MADEKKEDNKTKEPQAAPQANQVPAKPEEAKPQASQTPVKPEEAKAAAPAEKAKKEKPANCAGCNKSIKKKRWYYRSGKFYCTKRCWKTALEKEAKPADAQSAEQK